MVPGTSDGDDSGIGTDPLSEFLSWDVPERPLDAPGQDAPTSSDSSETVERAENPVPGGGPDTSNGEGPSEHIATTADQETEATPVAADLGTQPPVFGPPSFGQPGYGTAEYGASGYGRAVGQQAYGQGSPLPSGYGPAPYGQPSWSSPQWTQAGWSQQWGYGEHRKPKAPRRPPRTMQGWLGVATAAALVGALVGAGLVSVFASRAPQTIVREYFPTVAGKVQSGDVQSILASVLPAVVSIDTSGFRGAGGFGNYVQGAGTGMIIEPSGVVLTNNHVIAGAQTLSVTLYGQTKQFPAKIIGADPRKDIALVQIEGAGHSLPTVRFGSSNTSRQGDGVLAIGNALALAGGPTVTEGIVSAENRSLTATTDDGTTENLTGLIQTDAPINPGNSGGPLVNAFGQVVAMNTAVATSSQGNAPAQNVGFAIAVDEIRTIVAQILQTSGAH